MKDWIKPIKFSQLLGGLLVGYLGFLALPMVLQYVVKLLKFPFLFGVLYYTWLKESPNFRLLRIADHEFTHALVALLFFRRLDEIFVSGREGYVQSSSPFLFGSVIVGLAPYVVRLSLVFVTCFVAWVLLLDADSKMAYFLLGVIFAYFYVTIFREARPHQPDLQETNILHSYVCIISGNVLMLGFMLSVILPEIRFLEFVGTLWQKALPF